MLSPEYINRIIGEFIGKTKTWSEDRTRNGYASALKALTGLFEVNTTTIPNQLPEYWIGYNYAVQQMQSIEPHTRRALFPERLFNLRTPNQTLEELEYIRSTFKSVTLPVWNDFISTISRGANRSNYAVRIDAEERLKADFEDYLSYYFPNYTSYWDWVQSYLIPLKQKDSNGVMATMPHELPTTIGEDGVTRLTNDLVRSYPVYFSSKNIVGQEHGEYYLLLAPNEKSIVIEGGKPRKIGSVLYLFDDTYIYRIEQTGEMKDFKFTEPTIYFEHLGKEIPVRKLGGIPNFINDNIVFDSVFSYVSDILDLVLLDQNNLNIGKAKSMYAFRIMLGSICDFEIDGARCDKGYILNDNGSKSKCPACKGRGSIPRVSPLGEMLINPEDQFGNGDKLNGLQSPIMYVAPPIEPSEFLVKQIDSNERRARQILHLADSDAAVQGNEGQTATGSLNKLRSTYAFIKPISDQIFNVAFGVLDDIASQRYGDNVIVTATPPNTFDINTPSDYLAAISEAKAMGVAPFVMYQLYWSYLSSISHSDAETRNAYNLIINTDSLLANTQDEIALRIASGTAEKWMDVVHNSGLVLIYNLIEKQPNFFEQPFETQQAQLIDAAKLQISNAAIEMRAELVI
jgi:hypothetical protein